VDELNSVVGVARATAPTELFDTLLEGIQRDLFAIGGRLATPEPEKVAKAIAKAVLPPERVESFELAMDQAEEELPPLRAFVLPGGTPKAAALHLARTVCRRAERSAVRLAREEAAPAEILVYLNRLSDLLFTLARLANHRGGAGDTTW
jgi:cob(I)alamin adenosyltransferase